MTEYTHRVKQFHRPIASRLGQLDIELTERCNNDCIHCCIDLPANDANARSREMTTAQVKDILTQAAALGCLRVRFTGGEPLLRPDFEELYLFARRLGIKVLLFTNARLLTPRLADLFARIPPRVTIEVTVYGMRAESYDAVARVPGAFAQFWRGVNLLLERRVPFVVKAALLPPNRAEMEVFEAWAKTIPWMDKPPSYSMNFDLRNRRDDARKNAQLAALRLSPEETVAMLTRDDAKYRKSLHEFASKFMGPPGDELFKCGAGHGMCIDAYGRAQPCMGIRAPELTVDLLGQRSRGAGEIQLSNYPTTKRFGAIHRAPRNPRDEPGIPASLRALFPQGLVRAMPGEIMGGKWHARYAGRVSVRGCARASPLAGLAGGGRTRVGGGRVARTRRVGVHFSFGANSILSGT
jgi:MoaA/NifB/PqqE/SkfB family radical SAM enzyme